MKAGALWPLAIVGTLAVTVGANIMLLVAARDPNAYVVEPHYYEKALAWDSTMALARRSAALNWRMDAQFGRWLPQGTGFTLTLADSARAPLSGANVAAELISNLDPERALHPALREDAPGHYVATALLPRAGMWEVRVHVRHGRDEYAADMRRDATADPAK